MMSIKLEELSLEMTEELERAIEIKKQVEQLCRDFKNYFKLDAGTFKKGRFNVWSDSDNATFISVSGDDLIFQCRFLHESYDVLIKPSALFEMMRDKYKGIEHFKSAVSMMKRKVEGVK